MSVLNATIGAWKDVRFEAVKAKLDATAGDIATQQDESDASRRRLVELSREFKASTPPEVRKTVAPLLKAFQGEVDGLVKRAKGAEVAYLEVYKQLIDLPDPAPAFDYVSSVLKKLQRMSDLEVENQQLRERLTEFNAEFAEVKNQEVTVKQLREKVKELEEAADDAVANAIRDREKQLSMKYGEKEKELAAKQFEVAQRLGEAENKAAGLQQAFDAAQTEVFDLRQKLEERGGARADEVELLQQDLDRALESGEFARREVERLQGQLKAAQMPAAPVQADSAASVEEMMRRADLEMELATKEREVGQLVEDNRRLQKSLTDLREASFKTSSELESQLAAKTIALVSCEERLNRQTDYEELKKELKVLKSIQFGEEESAVSEEKSLEQKLLEQNRGLQDEVTHLRMRTMKLQEENKTLLYEVKDGQRELQEQKKLVQQLEEDLQKMKAYSALFRGKAEGEETSKEAAVLASVVEQVESPGSPKPPGDTSLLAIVQSQRERFRTRAQELEVQTVSQQQQLQLVQADADRLRSDNVKLYEKIKFLQSYNSSEQGDASVASRYSDDYEARLDPFNTFSRQERQRSYAKLRPHDKLTLSIGRFIMSSSTARAVVCIYVLLLHLLVFLVLYRMAHAEDGRRDLSAACQRRFAEHMLNVHGDKSHAH